MTSLVNRLVFFKVNGSMCFPTSFDRRFGRAVADVDIGVFRFHELDHVHATVLRCEGAKVGVTAQRPGYAALRIPLDISAHILCEMQEEAEEKFWRVDRRRGRLSAK